jgi:hypothetical protein
VPARVPAQGAVRALLRDVLAIGCRRGHPSAQISILLGNEPARRAYEQVGFMADREKRHPDFAATVGVPGMLRMVRALEDVRDS